MNTFSDLGLCWGNMNPGFLPHPIPRERAQIHKATLLTSRNTLFSAVTQRLNRCLSSLYVEKQAFLVFLRWKPQTDHMASVIARFHPGLYSKSDCRHLPTWTAAAGLAQVDSGDWFHSFLKLQHSWQISHSFVSLIQICPISEVMAMNLVILD